MSWLESWIGQHPVLGAWIYVILLVASVVLLPFSSLPPLPLATRSYGVVLTALLSAAGWWGGCLIAFQIARFGRRHLERFASLEAVDRLEGNVPADVGFGGIVVLRMILPVDVVSFALGLLKRLRFRTYAVASLVGILPFAFRLELRRRPARRRPVSVLRSGRGRHGHGRAGAPAPLEGALVIRRARSRI